MCKEDVRVLGVFHYIGQRSAVSKFEAFHGHGRV
jgi:hypothetical protein